MPLISILMRVFIRQPTLADLRRGINSLFSANINKTFYSIIHQIQKIEYEKRFTWLFSMKNE